MNAALRLAGKAAIVVGAGTPVGGTSNGWVRMPTPSCAAFRRS